MDNRAYAELLLMDYNTVLRRAEFSNRLHDLRSIFVEVPETGKYSLLFYCVKQPCIFLENNRCSIMNTNECNIKCLFYSSSLRVTQKGDTLILSRNYTKCCEESVKVDICKEIKALVRLKEMFGGKGIDLYVGELGERL